MTLAKWVGLTGRAGAGKTFVAERLVAAGGHMRASFAHALRAEIERELGVPRGSTNLWAKPSSEAIRFILQKYGTDFRRAQDPDYWVKSTLDAWHSVVFSPVFDDVRFPNEAEAIRAKGGIIVRVLAPPEVREQRLGRLPPEHASETSMDDYEADMHITSVEDNLAFYGQLSRILVDASWDDDYFLRRISESLRD